MWKYKCKSQLLLLAGAFLVGAFSMFIFSQSPEFLETASEFVQADILSYFSNSIWLLSLFGGMVTAGFANVFVIGTLLSGVFGAAMLLVFALFLLLPDIMITVCTIAVPVMVIVLLYGMISLQQEQKKQLEAFGISSDDQIVAQYLEGHVLLDEYRELAKNVKQTAFKVDLCSWLGLVALYTVMIPMQNFFLSILVMMLGVFILRALMNVKAKSYNSVSALLLEQCDPPACISTLFYMSRKRNGHYKFVNRSLLAQCFVYSNEPRLAREVLVRFPRPNVNAALTYWSITASAAYLLKDEALLYDCKDAITSLRPAGGQITMMVRSSELASVENKIRLLDGDYNTCKKYFLEVLRHSVSRLQTAYCDYYIALLSFAQEDYQVAKLYFNNAIAAGNKLYFTKNARMYLKKIEESENPAEYIDQPE
jgi:hypothetical protein